MTTVRDIPAESCSVEQLASKLCAVIEECHSVVVAFSGGVDSAVVSKAAAIALGERACAAIGIGPALAATEYRDAVRVASEIGITLVEVTPDELSDAGYVANAGDRCYFCKTRLYQAARQVAEARGISVICNGTNRDDLGDYRPGLRAADEADIRSPLASLGINKVMVRQLARYWGLSVADKPAAPCLASRIAPGIEVTAARLGRVERAEAMVRDRTQLAEIRVRVEAGELARIELPAADISRSIQTLADAEFVAAMKALGFRAVSLDLEGFRSGSLNALVPLEIAEIAG